MPGNKNRILARAKQQIPRIRAAEAAKILKQCEHLLKDSREVLAGLHRFGFAEFLGCMSEDILRLAIQPDAWGERMRARLMSDIAPALQGDVSGQHAVSIDDIVHCANVVTPCFLLELGRRKRHIEVELPSDPTDSSARFRLRMSESYPFHSINNEQLLQLVAQRGEELVGLCYFGDQESRASVETELDSQSPARNLKGRPCRSSTASKATQ